MAIQVMFKLILRQVKGRINLLKIIHFTLVCLENNYVKTGLVSIREKKDKKKHLK